MSLTDDQIREVAWATKSAEPGRDGYILPFTFARAIEAAVLAAQSDCERGDVKSNSFSLCHDGTAAVCGISGQDAP